MNQPFLTLGLALFATLLAASLRADEGPDREGVEFFEQKIRPVLVEHCYQCHSAQAQSAAGGKGVKGGLRLDDRQATRRGGESGPAVVPGDADASLILEALRYDSFEMPPKGRLPARIIADFEKWIKSGAADPRDAVASTSKPSEIDWSEARSFWSFQPPRRQSLPVIDANQWPRRRIDYFVLAQIEAAELTPNEPADRRALARRVTFDLTGLPPSAELVQQFVGDPRPDAYERFVERLLTSPRFGERWARLWLDVARYAEDQAHIVGKNSSLFYPNAYLYRDWVIDAFNADMPYDRFVRLQLAADLMGEAGADHDAALGFIGLGPKYYRRNAPEVMADEWEDRVDTVSRGLLGLTVACARCHDHKYDPIRTEDYYALAGVFASTRMFNQPLDPKRPLDKGGEAKKPADALHVVRDTTPTDLPVHLRGDATRHGELVPRRFVEVLCDDEPPTFSRGSGRLELADAILAPSNPLADRVLVNRVWAECFGRPLVDTPSNFGKLGVPPSHPHLLDDLAARFQRNGRSLKWLVRELVLSSTYRQSSRLTPAQQSTDPSNRLLARMSRRRLSVEMWRDALLAVSGQLSLQLKGPSIDPALADSHRRTVYARISRLELNPLLATFDFPDPNAHAARRVQTTTALQKLFVLNSPFMALQSERLATRMMAAAEQDEQRINWAVETLLARSATDNDRQWAREFLGPDDDGRPQRWIQYAQVLLASNEMLFLD